MRTLLLLALVSLVLNVGLAVQFSDDDLEVKNDELTVIPEGLLEENPKRYHLYEITLKTIN